MKNKCISIPFKFKIIQQFNYVEKCECLEVFKDPNKKGSVCTGGWSLHNHDVSGDWCCLFCAQFVQYCLSQHWPHSHYSVCIGAVTAIWSLLQHKEVKTKWPNMNCMMWFSQIKYQHLKGIVIWTEIPPLHVLQHLCFRPVSAMDSCSP